MHSSPPDRLNIFPVGGPFWESYSKALHGASKTSLVRRIQKNYRDKAYLVNWWYLTGQPMQVLRPVKWRVPWDNEATIACLLKSYYLWELFGEVVTENGADTCQLGCMYNYYFPMGNFILFYFCMGNFKQTRKKILMLLNEVKGRNVKQQQPSKGKPESFLQLQQSEKFK